MNTKDHHTTLEKVRHLSFRHNGPCYQTKTKKTPGEPTLAELLGWKST
jgi:thiamine monophosphate synthase